MIELSWRSRTSRFRQSVPSLAPGLLVAGLVATAAQFLADHHGSPAMLMALLLGISLNFLSEEGRCVEGVHFASRTALRFGVALLGARVSVELMVELGPHLIGIVIGAVLATIVFGMWASRLLGAGWRLGLLTGGAVGICGASAAMAIAAILAKTADAERNLVLTVLGVTVLSTAAMLAYPLVAELLGFDDRSSGVFIGATIHDVAQVVGAGFSVSDKAGEAATLVKLVRVTMLAPVVLLLAFAMHFGKPEDKPAGARTAIVPGFILAFALLAALNSAHLIPEQASKLAAQLSSWALLTAIAAVGMRTSLKQMLEIGGDAIVLILVETAFLTGLVIAGLEFIQG